MPIGLLVVVSENFFTHLTFELKFASILTLEWRSVCLIVWEPLILGVIAPHLPCAPTQPLSLCCSAFFFNKAVSSPNYTWQCFINSFMSGHHSVLKTIESSTIFCIKIRFIPTCYTGVLTNFKLLILKETHHIWA